MGSSDGRKLRVGLLMDSFNIPAWAYLMLKKIGSSTYAEIKLCVLNDARKVKTTFIPKAKDNLGSLFYIAYRKFENRLFKPYPNAFEVKDATELLENIPIIRIKPRQTEYFSWVEDKDTEELDKFEIDVFIQLGFGILRGKVLGSAKFGIWYYHHGDNNAHRGVPAGFWEVFEHHPVTASMLQILNKDFDNGLVLFKSYSATDSLSINRNCNNFYWKTLSFIPRKLKELHKIGEEKFFSKVREENQHLTFYSHRLYQQPKNAEFTILLVKHLIKYAAFKISNIIFFQQWILLFNMCDGTSTEFWRFNKIIPPKDRFWADPYILYIDNIYYIFIEEFLYRNKKGHISVLTMDDKGNYNNPVKILERPYHLSHPFIFKWDGIYYMIPESFSNKTIEVYKCTDFPYKWEFYKNMFEDITAADTILYNYHQTWWLFTTVAENDGASPWDELFVFYSDNPLGGDWKAHLQNPILSDARRARPAGKILEYNGNIYRFSQDCSKGYGYGIRVNQIVKLNETEYHEREISFIEPNWDKHIKSVHTFDHENRLTIIDGKVRRLQLPQSWWRN